MVPRELLVLHHTHVDIGYTHPQGVVWELHSRYLDEAIDLCEQTSDYPEGSRMKWTCEITGVALHWLKTATPDRIRRMQRLVANGQMGFGAMMFHWTALHQEDLLRESLHGIKVMRDSLGARMRFAMQTDVNGMPWSVPDMLMDAGLEGLMMSINIHMGGFALTRPKVFRWGAPSGRELLVYSGEHYNAFTREAALRNGSPLIDVKRDLDLDRMQAGLERYFVRLEKKGWNHEFAILTATNPCMDDNGPPNAQLPDVVRHWNESGRGPMVRIVSLEELFARVSSLEPQGIPKHSGDWTDYWTNGVGSSALEVTMSRRAHGALWGARALATALAPCPARTRADASAVAAMHQANEHTWNVFSSTGALGTGGSGKIEPIPEAEQRLYKSAQCAAALTFARMARRDAMDALAGNPSQAPCEEALLVFNPSELPRRVCLRLPHELLSGTYQLVGGTKHRLDVIEDVLAETGATTWAGPVEVPPLSYLTVPLARLSAAEPAVADGGMGEGFICSPYWRIGFDGTTGAVESLRHLGTGRECFDSELGLEMFGPVQETLAKPSALAQEVRDPRASFFSATERNFDEVVHEDGNGWESDWASVLNRPVAVRRVRVRRNLEGVHLDRWLEMPGINGEIRLTISLPWHEDRVRFTAYFNKSDIMEPESLYFSFPFQMDNAHAYFDTAGVVVGFENEQLPGASRGWVTAGSMMVVAGRGGSLTLACPDAPLFQVGGFHYGRDLKCARGLNQALLLAWPMNNYWNTNFRASQPGLVRFRYELSCAAAFDAAASARFAGAVARPVMFHPVVSLPTQPPAGTLVRGLPATVSIVSLKPSGPDRLVLVLRNHDTKPCEVRPEFPGRRVKSIGTTGVLEEQIKPLAVNEAVVIPMRSAVAIQVIFDS